MPEQKTIDLFQYLYNRQALMVDQKFAQRLNIPTEVLVAMVREGLGPELRPALASNRYWFLKATLSSWKYWPLKANELELERAAEIVRNDDRARRIQEFAAYDNYDSRSFLTAVFARKRR
ncbi:hypothetical protein RB623_26215 [Mesorhizobium sp. LHD-90]|uniref:hypothetical protein n=1 Tax=Mesorhizobium sp. LHD-90 TaxID=3071414 RepID=UPI0027DFF067|nr:hypothetical protein [Mesorhizobium sp. LHD-90]MDQ6437563.1 hypothetical protein [Mesorhizobium sp. LHD-90]